MLPFLQGKQRCLNFRVTFLFNPVAGIFELPVKNFAILLMVTIAFSETVLFQFSSLEKNKGPDTTFYK